MKLVPAVVAPSLLNAGFSFARPVKFVVGRMPSSTEITTGFSFPVCGSTIFHFKTLAIKVRNIQPSHGKNLIQQQVYLCQNWDNLIFELSRSSCSSCSLVRNNLQQNIVGIRPLVVLLKAIDILIEFKNLTAAWSCSSRVTPNRCATFSEVMPIGRRQSRACAKASTY